MALKTAPYKGGAVSSHGGPVVAPCQQVVQLLPPYVVVAQMLFLHDQHLEPTWGVGQPTVVPPGIQLICEGQVASCSGEVGVEVLGRGEVEQVALQGDILRGAGEAMC